MSTDTAQYEFHRKLKAAPDRLWHLLTDPQMRGQWGAPTEGTVLEVVSSDMRVGGVEHHRCGPADAPEFEVTSRWYRLDAPSDAAYTETVEIAGDAIATSLVTYRVAPAEAGSNLFVTVAVSSFVGPQGPDDFRTGWDAALTNLAALVARG